MVTPMALIYKVLFPSISTFETPPACQSPGERGRAGADPALPSPGPPVSVGDRSPGSPGDDCPALALSSGRAGVPHAAYPVRPQKATYHRDTHQSDPVANPRQRR